MEHKPCAIKYARQFKEFGVKCLSENSYFGHCECDEIEWRLEKNADIPKHKEGDNLQLPALTMQELHWILSECDHSVSYGGGELPDDIVRITMFGQIDMDVKIYRLDRTDTDLMAECVLKLLKDEFIDGDFINEVLGKYHPYDGDVPKEELRSIEQALEAMKELVESMQEIINITRCELDEIIKCRIDG